MNRPTVIDASLQRVIRAPANQVLTATLFPNDPSFNVSGDTWAELEGWVCGPPCKMVRVAMPLSGRVRARVTWPPSGTDFGCSWRSELDLPHLAFPGRTEHPATSLRRFRLQPALTRVCISVASIIPIRRMTRNYRRISSSN